MGFPHNRPPSRLTTPLCTLLALVQGDNIDEAPVHSTKNQSSMTYPNEVFTAFAFLGFLLCAIPLPWHLEGQCCVLQIPHCLVKSNNFLSLAAWNTGTCLYMIWTGLACLNHFINSIVWRGNAINCAPVWCDISTKFNIGAGFAIPAASLCINRRLYHIASVKTVTISKAEKRRAVYIDLAIGLGLPVLGMTLRKFLVFLVSIVR